MCSVTCHIIIFVFDSTLYFNKYEVIHVVNAASGSATCCNASIALLVLEHEILDMTKQLTMSVFCISYTSNQPVSTRNNICVY